MRLLVSALPQVGPHVRFGALRLREQYKRQQHQPAATKTERGKRQQREQQPRPAIEEARALHFDAGRILRRFAARSEHTEQRIEITRVVAIFCVASTTRLRERGQRRAVELRQHDVSGLVLEEAAVAERDRRTLRAADAEHRHVHAGAARTRGRCVGAVTHTVGEQDDFAFAQAGLMDQLDAKVDGTAGVVARRRHHRRIERIDEAGDRVRIVGQRRDDEGIAGVGDQRDLRIARAFQNVGDLVTRALETARLHVLRGHRGRQLKRDHARGLVLVQRLRQALPSRPCEGEACDHKHGERKPHRPTRGRRVRIAHEQMFEQMRVDRATPRLRVAGRRLQHAP